MCRKNMCLISVILVLGMVGSALAADVDWTNAGGDRLWSNASNWSAGVPTDADKAGIRQGGDGPIIDTGTAAEALNLVVGDWSSPADNVTITGGTLTVATGGWFILGYQASNNGTFNVDGGTTTINANLQVGFMGTGNLNVTAGLATVTGTLGLGTSGGSGSVILNGGTVSCGAFSITTGSMDVGGGTLIVNGDATALINSYVGGGLITAYSGAGTVAVDYNVSNPGQTTVTANSPEKASYPTPPHGVTGVSINADLSWSPGAYATSHDVYFGIDATPDAGEFMGNQPGTTYDLPEMALGTTYFWRIDEVDTGNPESPWVGDVWSFTTQLNTATLKKGPYLIYPDNGDMQVLWQLDVGDACSLAWGLNTSYSDGDVDVYEYGTDHQYEYTITGLTPGAKYYYRVTVGAGYSTGSFTAAPADSATDIKFLMYGDTRTYPANHDIVCAGMSSVIASDPAYQTMILLAGDYVSIGDDETDWTDEFFNRSYSNLMQFQATMPINGARGNHENTATVFKKYYPYPYVNSCYWSFDYGPVHVAVVDQYIDFTAGSVQHNWLTNDLATSSKDWNIIVLHEPGWTAMGGHTNNTDVQNYLQPLCEQYGVQIVLGGHNHYYARGVVNDVHHLTSGGGGAPLYAPKQGEPAIVIATQTFNFQTVEISGNMMTVNTLQPDGTVIDTFTAIISECGDGNCDLGEECDCPADCGTPPSTETSCTDGTDNDCDLDVDCDDSDCSGDPACQCGNGTCDPGEDCNSCLEDCIFKKNQYCCGDGTCEGIEDSINCAIDCGGGSYCDDGTCDPGEDQCNCPQDCGTPPSTETNCDDGNDEDCDGSTDCDDSDCLGDPACPSCGDETCDPGEDQCNCPADCGTPPSVETTCDDGIDEDCDGNTDCNDSDCEGDPACPDCGLPGDPCTTGADCCSGRCNTGVGECK